MMSLMRCTQVRKDFDRDEYFTAEQAQNYGEVTLPCSTWCIFSANCTILAVVACFMLAANLRFACVQA